MPEAGTVPLIVCKIGGSLLDRPHLPDLVRTVVGQCPGRGVILVVGGGPVADLVRTWDSTHQLGDDAAHWLALEAMRLNEALVERLLPEARPVRNAKQAAAVSGSGAIGILCTDCFVRWGEATDHPLLPRSWNVTSDSIAAWAAQILDARELILLKSVALPHGISCAEAAAAGLVDESFPAMAAGLPRVSWVNGRSEPIVIQPWP